MKSRFKILVADDSPTKVSQIQDALATIPDANIDLLLTDSIIGAKEALLRESFNLLLLDVQIPLRTGERPIPRGGERLLSEICKNSRYSKPAHVIGITAFQEEFSDIEAWFKKNSWILLQSNYNEEGWCDQIRDTVEYFLQFDAQAVGLPSADVCVITALDELELDSIRKLPFSWKKINGTIDNTPYISGTFADSGGTPRRIVSAAAPQMGMPSACCLAIKLIEEFRPKYLIMCGIAAGVKGTVQLGDLLVAEESFDWGSGKLKAAEGRWVLAPDPRSIPADTQMLNHLRALRSETAELRRIKDSWPAQKPETEISVRIGPVGSGAPVVANSQIIDGIKEHHRKLIGIEMETYGVYYAARHYGTGAPNTISIKAVCDFADDNKNDTYQAYAAYVSASVLELLLQKYIAFP